MNEAVTSTVITAIFLLLTTVVFLFLLDVWTDQSEATAEATRRHAEQLDMAIGLSSIADDAAELDCGLFSVQVANTGSVAISDFTDLDLIAQYTDKDGNQVNPYLDYATDWSVSSISPDTVDPNVLIPVRTFG